MIKISINEDVAGERFSEMINFVVKRSNSISVSRYYTGFLDVSEFKLMQKAYKEYIWLIYLSDYEMSRYGIYTIFSYNLHEVLGLIPFLSIFITIIWLLFTIVKGIKEKGKKSNWGLGLILLALCIIQILFIKNQYQTWSTSCVTSVKRIQESKMEITINQNGNNNKSEWNRYNIGLPDAGSIYDKSGRHGIRYYI